MFKGEGFLTPGTFVTNLLYSGKSGCWHSF
jgi:hypothetical protein